MLSTSSDSLVVPSPCSADTSSTTRSMAPPTHSATAGDSRCFSTAAAMTTLPPLASLQLLTLPLRRAALACTALPTQAARKESKAVVVASAPTTPSPQHGKNNDMVATAATLSRMTADATNTFAGLCKEGLESNLLCFKALRSTDATTAAAPTASSSSYVVGSSSDAATGTPGVCTLERLVLQPAAAAVVAASHRICSRRKSTRVAAAENHNDSTEERVLLRCNNRRLALEEQLLMQKLQLDKSSPAEINPLKEQAAAASPAETVLTHREYVDVNSSAAAAAAAENSDCTMPGMGKAITAAARRGCVESLALPPSVLPALQRVSRCEDSSLLDVSVSSAERCAAAGLCVHGEILQQQQRRRQQQQQALKQWYNMPAQPLTPLLLRELKLLDLRGHLDPRRFYKGALSSSNSGGSALAAATAAIKNGSRRRRGPPTAVYVQRATVVGSSGPVAGGGKECEAAGCTKRRRATRGGGGLLLSTTMRDSSAQQWLRKKYREIEYVKKASKNRHNSWKRLRAARSRR